jgi:predicted nucleic acid-binding protein
MPEPIAPHKNHPPKPDRPVQQRKHRIAEGRLQIQPLTQPQTVVQLLKQTIDQGEAEAMDSADWL